MPGKERQGKHSLLLVESWFIQIIAEGLYYPDLFIFLILEKVLCEHLNYPFVSILTEVLIAFSVLNIVISEMFQ